jgi:hypothetical protein
MVRSCRGSTCSWMWAALKWSDVVQNLCAVELSLSELSMVRSYRGSTCSWMWAALKWSDVEQNSCEHRVKSLWVKHG